MLTSSLSGWSKEKLLFLTFSLVLLLSLFGGSSISRTPLLGRACTRTYYLLSYSRFFQNIFVLLFFGSFSFEYSFPNGFGTDLPTEPIMIGLAGLSLIYLLGNFFRIKTRHLTHPVVILLGLHLSWVIYTSLNSQSAAISFKWVAAKIWYFLPFFVLPFFILKEKFHYEKMFSALSAALIGVVIFVMIKHSTFDFSFKDINEACEPIFRNHVDYACILIITLPYLWLVFRWSDPGSFSKEINFYGASLISGCNLFDIHPCSDDSCLIGYYILLSYKNSLV